MYETVVPPLDERDFEKTVTPIVQEYFEHGDTNEVAVSAKSGILCKKQSWIESKLTSLCLSRSCLQS